MLAKFARRKNIQLESMLWFYLDSRHIDKISDVSNALHRFCDLKDETLNSLKEEVRVLSSPSLAMLSRVLIAVRVVLVQQLYEKFITSDLAISELPLATLLEN